MSALRLINETTVSASTSSVDVTDVFSADFDIYKITTNNFSTVGTTATALDLRFLNESGSVITNSKYDYGYWNMKAETTFAEVRATDATFIDNFLVTDQSPEVASSVTYVFNPFSSSSYTYLINQSSRRESGNFRSQKYIAVLKQERRMGGFRLFETNSRPFDSGVIRTYGLRVDS
tara:strand:+ start:1416 stop:1943 length:528 start_codon:yes stop_codon:yes gene_type:complete